MLRDGGPASMGGQAPNMAPNTNGGVTPAMNMAEGFDPKANKIVTIGASFPVGFARRRGPGEGGHRLAYATTVVWYSAATYLAVETYVRTGLRQSRSIGAAPTVAVMSLTLPVVAPGRRRAGKIFDLGTASPPLSLRRASATTPVQEVSCGLAAATRPLLRTRSSSDCPTLHDHFSQPS